MPDNHWRHEGPLGGGGEYAGGEGELPPLASAFAVRYAAEMDIAGEEDDERRSIRHPAVFVFLGDLTAEGVEQVYAANRKRWNNNEGVGYLHIGTGAQAEQASGDERIFRFALPGGSAAEADKKNVRPLLHKRFYSDEAKLLELNVLLRRMNARIAEYGRLYTHLQRVHIAFVTRADDPCTVVLPEVAALIQTIFGEQFRSVLMDLYVLTEERTAGGDYAYRATLGVGFLKELDRLQRREYRFEAPLQLTGDGIRMSVTHPASPLFDLVYVIGDKDERGLFAADGMRGGYELIGALNLLKNRLAAATPEAACAFYNRQQFKQNMTPDSGETAYATAGLAKVKRPNQAIALTVVHHAYRKLLGKLREAGTAADRKAAWERLELSPVQTERAVRSMLPAPEEAAASMAGLMHAPLSYGEVKGLSLRQAEAALYGRHAADFFDSQVAVKANAALDDGAWTERLQGLVGRQVLSDPALGLFPAYRWTAENGPDSLTAGLHDRAKAIGREIDEAAGELEQKYSERVDAQSFAKGGGLLSWARPGQPLKAFVRFLFEDVYGRKLGLLALELERGRLLTAAAVLEQLHAQLGRDVVRLERLEKRLLEASRSSISSAGDYLGRNVHEYYGQAVDEAMAALEEQHGERFYFEERQVGDVTARLREGEEALLERLIRLIRSAVFTHKRFGGSFEDELLERANVAVSYENRGVLTKEELFRDLYQSLEHESAVRADVYNSTHRHRYEEKYVIGDTASEFVQYVLSADQSKRIYKLGCVHEASRSGVEKLTIMGGFRLEDLMYYRNGLRYYETYVQNGFRLHAAEDEGALAGAGEQAGLADRPGAASGEQVELANRPVAMSGEQAELANRPGAASGEQTGLTARPYAAPDRDDNGK